MINNYHISNKSFHKFNFKQQRVCLLQTSRKIKKTLQLRKKNYIYILYFFKFLFFVVVFFWVKIEKNEGG